MTDFLDQKRSEITKRLNDLKPLMDEYQRLEAASSALAQLTGPAAAAPTRNGARRGPGRPRGKRAATTATKAPATRSTRTTRTTRTTAKRTTRRRSATASPAKRPGRRRGSGARTAQTLEIVQSSSAGVTIPELAEKMGIKQNYLYRVLPALQKEGKVRKRGRTWLPKDAA